MCTAIKAMMNKTKAILSYLSFVSSSQTLMLSVYKRTNNGFWISNAAWNLILRFLVLLPFFILNCFEPFAFAIYYLLYSLSNDKFLLLFLSQEIPKNKIKNTTQYNTYNSRDILFREILFWAFVVQLLVPLFFFPSHF